MHANLLLGCPPGKYVHGKNGNKGRHLWGGASLRLFIIGINRGLRSLCVSSLIKPPARQLQSLDQRKGKSLLPDIKRNRH